MKSEMEKIAGGKQLTWKQYMRKKQAYEEEQKAQGREANEIVSRPGVCECGTGTFEHRIDNHELIRICKNPECREEVTL